MNIYDIAKLANVSIATVSRVVNDSPNVSIKTKERVLSIMEQEGYTPNVFARGLGLGSMKTIGIICPDVADIYMAKAIAIIENHLKMNEYQSLLVCSGYQQEEKKRCVDLLISKKVDALILIGSTYASDGIESRETTYIQNAGKIVPVFLINGVLPYKNVYSACCDDYNAIYQVTTDMIKNGHDQILFLYNATSYSAKQKMLGYEHALRDNQLPINGQYKIYVENDIPKIRDLLLGRKDITFNGVIAVEDSLAIGALKYANMARIEVPKQLSIVGFNNSFLATCCEPELSSVDSKIGELCLSTAEHVVTVLENDAQKTALIQKEMKVKGEFRRRNTTDF